MPMNYLNIIADKINKRKEIHTYKLLYFKNTYTHYIYFTTNIFVVSYH